MKRLFLFGLICLATCVSSCTMPFWVYIRNKTNEIAVVHVVLLDKSSMQTLPNKVKVADKIVAFKSGFRQSFYEKQNVQWIDTSQFSFNLLPGTTIDLADMAGKFVNSHPTNRVLVTVTANNKADTLLNPAAFFRSEKFMFKNVGISVPVLYYDVLDSIALKRDGLALR